MFHPVLIHFLKIGERSGKGDILQVEFRDPCIIFFNPGLYNFDFLIFFEYDDLSQTIQ